MGLNLSNAQIARELGLNEGDLHQMVSPLRKDIHEKRPVVVLSGQVEADELYVIAGHIVSSSEKNTVNYPAIGLRWRTYYRLMHYQTNTPGTANGYPADNVGYRDWKQKRTEFTCCFLHDSNA
jgi:hypothetical protein